eukprot:TRINITY_DN8186_c0_g1_i3.p1 TRINITY_DN8186_c0_g1~~TRINITY_DN8186_c0_g1_i3.p1  ORF type:complete len:107 (+),score=29.59 TRINITY_DN8186_c0_g1_i3:135-455(+)
MLRSLVGSEMCIRDSHIYTDSTYCIKGITLFMKNWLNNGFKKSDKSPVLNKELWMSIHSLMLDLQRQFESASLAGVGHKRERSCLLYTSDAADEEDSVDLGGRRII